MKGKDEGPEILRFKKSPVVFCIVFSRLLPRVLFLRGALAYRLAGRMLLEDSGHAAGTNNNVF